MIGTRTREDWDAISREPAQALRALADWTADILTVMRLVSGAAGMAGLADSKPGTAYYHAEQVQHWLVERVTGGMTHTDITPELTARWVALAADRNHALSLLADELGELLKVLNAVSGNSVMWMLGVGSQGMPYWHAGRAHQYVLALLVGNVDDGYRLHELWSDNQEPTAHNLGLLQKVKEEDAVVVRVSADGASATVTVPGSGGVATAGRTEGGSGLFWVTALDSDDVISHEPAWLGVGHAVATYYNLHAGTLVIVDYTGPETGADVSADVEPHTDAGSALSTIGDTVNTDTDTTRR